MSEPRVARLIPAELRRGLQQNRRRAWMILGAIGWGIPTSVLWSLIMTPLLVLDSAMPLDKIVLAMIAFIPLWMAGGVVWGLLMQRHFARLRAAQGRDQ